MQIQKSCLKEKDCAVIIQARMSSSRFPGKMMSLVGGIPLIEYMYRRCRQSQVPNILVATSVHESDDKLFNYCHEKGIPVYRGEPQDVLQRYIDAAKAIGVCYVVRVCGDTPLVDINLLEKLLVTLIIEKFDYVSCDRKACLSGFYSEAVTLEALSKCRSLTNERECLEHVTRFIVNTPGLFRVKFVSAELFPKFVRDEHLTIDYPQDLTRVNEIVRSLADPLEFSSADILAVLCNLRKKDFGKS